MEIPKGSGEEPSWREINDRLGVVNRDLAAAEEALEILNNEKAQGKVSGEEFERRYEILDQQISIAKYRQNRYLSMF